MVDIYIYMVNGAYLTPPCPSYAMLYMFFCGDHLAKPSIYRRIQLEPGIEFPNHTILIALQYLDMAIEHPPFIGNFPAIKNLHLIIGYIPARLFDDTRGYVDPFEEPLEKKIWEPPMII